MTWFHSRHEITRDLGRFKERTDITHSFSESGQAGCGYCSKWFILQYTPIVYYVLRYFCYNVMPSMYCSSYSDVHQGTMCTHVVEALTCPSRLQMLLAKALGTTCIFFLVRQWYECIWFILSSIRTWGIMTYKTTSAPCLRWVKQKFVIFCCTTWNKNPSSLEWHTWHSRMVII